MSRRSEDLWTAYQNARDARAKAEIAEIEARAAAYAADEDYDCAWKAETAAFEAWRAAVQETTEPAGTVPAGNQDGD